MGHGVEVMLDVVAVVECDGVVSAGHTIVGHAIGRASSLWIDKEVLAPAHDKLQLTHSTHACSLHYSPY